MKKNGDVLGEEFRKDEDIEKGYFPEGTVHEDVFFILGEMRFVWDKAKSDRCYAERGFDFRTAAMIFNDDACITEKDPLHSIDEERFLGIGIPTSHSVNEEAYIGLSNNVLYVVYTERTFDDEEEDVFYQRIISARMATPKEKKLYEDRKAIMFGN